LKKWINFKIHMTIQSWTKRILSTLHRSITGNEIEAATKSLSKNKSSGPDRLSAEFYQTFEEELRPALCKLFHEIKREGTLPNYFYETTITLIPKPYKDTSKRRTIGQSLMNFDAKILNKIMEIQIQQHIRNIIHHAQVGFKGGWTYANQ
jgi:hypothetical protein